MRPNWRNRHASRVEKPEQITWAMMAPVCPLCGFKCMTALQPIDYFYILQDHYTVCRGRTMNPDMKGWKFTGKPYISFKWDPEEPYVFWVYTVNSIGEKVLVGAYGVFEREDPNRTRRPTKEEAMAASKRYVIMWESAAKILGLEDALDSYEIRFICAAKYRGEWIGVQHGPRPDDYYVHRRTEADRHNIDVLAAMLGDPAWAEAAWIEYRPGRTSEETLQAVALAFASGELVRPQVPDNGVDTPSSISNGSGNFDSSVIGIFS